MVQQGKHQIIIGSRDHPAQPWSPHPPTKHWHLRRSGEKYLKQYGIFRVVYCTPISLDLPVPFKPHLPTKKSLVDSPPSCLSSGISWCTSSAYTSFLFRFIPERHSSMVPMAQTFQFDPHLARPTSSQQTNNFPPYILQSHARRSFISQRGSHQETFLGKVTLVHSPNIFNRGEPQPTAQQY